MFRSVFVFVFCYCFLFYICFSVFVSCLFVCFCFLFCFVFVFVCLFFVSLFVFVLFCFVLFLSVWFLGKFIKSLKMWPSRGSLILNIIIQVIFKHMPKLTKKKLKPEVEVPLYGEQSRKTLVKIKYKHTLLIYCHHSGARWRISHVNDGQWVGDLSCQWRAYELEISHVNDGQWVGDLSCQWRAMSWRSLMSMTGNELEISHVNDGQWVEDQSCFEMRTVKRSITEK